MPELPEVETIKNQLKEKIIGKKLNGQKIVDVRRRAKLLIIDFENGSSLVFHLKLTGQLIFLENTLGSGWPHEKTLARPQQGSLRSGSRPRSPDFVGDHARSASNAFLSGQPSPYKHTRKIFTFDDGSKLFFNDLRKFGWWKKVKNTKKIEEGFGPEPVAAEFTLPVFKDLLAKRPRSKIKPLLMDQSFIAGIGNLYSDEILFEAGVRPGRRVGELEDKEIKKIFRGIKEILKKAIKYKGSSVDTYRDIRGQKGGYEPLIKVYRKERCSRCGTKIKKIKIGGRSGHYCPRCQR